MKLVVHSYAEVWGGNEKWICLLAGGLLARGHAVHAFCVAERPLEARLRQLGVEVTPIAPKARGDLGLRFSRRLQELRPDALLLTSWSGDVPNILAARLAGVGRVVMRLGMVNAPRPRSLKALAFNSLDAIIVNAPEIRDRWGESFRAFASKRMHIVLNGVPPSPGLDRNVAAAALRERLALATDARIVGAVGNVTGRKGFDLLIDAFAVRRFGGVHLAIAGDGGQRPALEARAAQLGLGGRVHFLGHVDDVPRFLAGCSLFALSSRNEGMANVMLEAMTVGTPVLATMVSGTSTAIGPDREGRLAGWMVPPDDQEAMVEALDAVLRLLEEDPAAVRERVEEASRRIREVFTVERMVRECEEVLFGPLPST